MYFATYNNNVINNNTIVAILYWKKKGNFKNEVIFKLRILIFDVIFLLIVNTKTSNLSGQTSYIL